MTMRKKIGALLLCLLLVTALLSVTVGASEYYDEYDGYYDGYEDTDSSDILVRVLIGAGIGLASGLVTVLLMRRSMNTVRRQKNASVYTEKDSFALTESRDIYLYSRVTRTRIQSNNKKN